MWHGGTNYGTIHGLARPTESATSGPGTTCGSHNWSRGTNYGETGFHMTSHSSAVLYAQILMVFGYNHHQQGSEKDVPSRIV